MDNKIIEYIEVEKIHPHPNNPRKDLGDVEELSESIKAKGVLQNLTVVPSREHPGEYTAVIGHRRRAAAVKAGIEKVPCIITKMTEQEQFEVMMLENMQREDLSVYEQAQGFQMMLDFGNSIDEIVEKTGFSKSTVYHRLNIAKLNQKELQKKEKDENFQLSIRDLTALEKIENVRTRNKVLKEARDSRNLVYLANEAAKKEKREKIKKAILKKFKDRNIEPFPENEYTWNGKWNLVKTFNLDKDNPEKVTLKKSKEQQYYLSSRNGSLYIYERREQTQSQEKKGLSEEEKQLRRDRKQIKEIQENLVNKIESFIDSILKKQIDWIDGNEFISMIWKYLILSYIHLDDCNMLMPLANEENKEWWRLEKEQKNQLQQEFESLPVAYQMLVAARSNKIPDVYSHYLNYQKDPGDRVQILVDILTMFGFSVTDEEQQLINGTHELYRK